jgi:hypothetical protein
MESNDGGKGYYGGGKVYADGCDGSRLLWVVDSDGSLIVMLS